MFISLACIFLGGLSLSYLMSRLKLPDLVGMLVAGMLIGPYTLGILDNKLISIAPEIREIALIIILIRAGLGLNVKVLKEIGRPAFFMCFIPALFELTGVILIAPRLFNISFMEAALLGSVLAAVSPAVIVPRMLKLKEEGYGTDKKIPQLIMAGASVDDIFVIVLFTTFLTMAQEGQFKGGLLMTIPLAILVGIGVGILFGIIGVYFFRKIHLRDSLKVIIILSIGFLFVALEDLLVHYIPFSGLIAIMTMGVVLYSKYEVLAERLAGKFARLWIAFQILLFVLVGASVDLNYALKSTLPAFILIVCVLIIRAVGVMICLIKTPLTMNERLFCVVAYMPKATVQAAIGGIPLAIGLPSGEMILTVAIIAIIVTAPLGALGIDNLYKRILTKELTG